MKKAYHLLSLCGVCLFGSVYSDEVCGHSEMHSCTVSDADIEALAASIAEEAFHDGFQLGDLVTVFSNVGAYLDEHYVLSVPRKREALVRVIDRIIDITDTPYLPDFIFDPIFKLLVPPVAALMYPDTVQSLAVDNIAGAPSEEAIVAMANQILDKYRDGLAVQEVPSVIFSSVSFAERYSGLSAEEKGKVAKRLLAFVLDNTDTPYLPDFIFDEVFKFFGNSLIDFLIANRAAV